MVLFVCTVSVGLSVAFMLLQCCSMFFVTPSTSFTVFLISVQL